VATLHRRKGGNPLNIRRSALIILALCLFAGATTYLFVSRPNNEGVGNRQTIELGPTLTDLSDPARLTGFADNVFFASVLSQSGRVNHGPLPAVQYELEVLESIKGDLGGRVQVSALAASRADDVFSEGENAYSPLEVGATYLLSTRTHSSGKWQVAAIEESRQRVADEAHRLELRRTFVAALAKQIPYPVPSPNSMSTSSIRKVP